MASLKPIKIYGAGGPNPPKIPIVCDELNIPYEIDAVGFDKVKDPEYLAINPNGRIPAIHDPNTGITLWESGAIIAYLLEKYDSKRQISFAPGTPESYHAMQWLFFQVSGQGPYYGQSVWFHKYHPEQLPSAIERYNKEINRVTGVLESHLAKQEAGADGPWLVGGKYSFADLSFLTWQSVVTMVLNKDEYDVEKYPHVKAWHEKILAREAVKKSWPPKGSH